MLYTGKIMFIRNKTATIYVEKYNKATVEAPLLNIGGTSQEGPIYSEGDAVAVFIEEPYIGIIQKLGMVTNSRRLSQLDRGEESKVGMTSTGIWDIGIWKRFIYKIFGATGIGLVFDSLKRITSLVTGSFKMFMDLGEVQVTGGDKPTFGIGIGFDYLKETGPWYEGSAYSWVASGSEDGLIVTGNSIDSSDKVLNSVTRTIEFAWQHGIGTFYQTTIGEQLYAVCDSIENPTKYAYMQIAGDRFINIYTDDGNVSVDARTGHVGVHGMKVDIEADTEIQLTAPLVKVN